MAAKKAAAKKTAATKSAPAKKAAAKKSATKTPAKKAAVKASPKTAPPAAPALPEGALLAIAAARFADDIKAEDIVILDVSEVSSITDYFVICSGTSTPHLKAIAREVRANLNEHHGVKPAKPDGGHESHWVVLDYGIMMVHAFHPDKRGLYALEDLWSDAKTLEWRP